IAPAMALVQLLTEYPQLPAADTWSVGRELTGHLHGSTVEAYDRLYAYARVLGGKVRRAYDFTSAGTAFRSLRLHAVWRDVPVLLVLIVPVELDDAVLAEGREAEQRHQLSDPAEPVLPGACRKPVAA